MYPATPTFWLEHTSEVAWGLRRYASKSHGSTCETGYHDALVYLGRALAQFRERDGRRSVLTHVSGVPHDDPRWPAECRRGCGYRFTEGDTWQDWSEQIYRRATGQEYVLHADAGADVLGVPSAPPGAMWDAWWMPFNRGADDICLMVRLPNNHDWMVDGEANNCTRLGQPHQCWVRHGDPRTQPVTVDKSGDTCAAGAGSILSGDYHGFLQCGALTPG